MNNQEIERQFKVVKEMAAQAGISGVVYLDVDQAKGILRIKFKVTPTEKQREIVTGMALFTAQMSQAFGLPIFTRETKNEEVNNG